MTTRAAAVADGSGKMFDQIAQRYDLLNRILSMGMDRGWRRDLVDASFARRTFEAQSGATVLQGRRGSVNT